MTKSELPSLKNKLSPPSKAIIGNFKTKKN